MDWTSFASGIIGAGLGATLGAWANYRFWISRKEKERKYKLQENSDAVADILTQWVKTGYIEPSSPEDRWKLQTTYWKGILRLDRELVLLLSEVLQNIENGPGAKDAIVEARRVLHGLKEPDISADQIIHWGPVKED